MFLDKKLKFWVIIFLALTGLGFFGGHKAYAINTADDARSCQDSLRFIDIAHLECTLSDNTTKILFKDTNPTDNDDNIGGPAEGTAHRVNYEPTDYTNMCNPGRTEITGAFRQFFYLPGVTRDGGHNFKLSDAGVPHSFKLNFGYLSGNDCKRYDPDNSVINDTAGIATFLQFTGDNITSLDGVTDGSLSRHFFTPILSSGAISTGGYSTDDYKTCKGSLLLTTKVSGTETRAENYVLKNGTLDAAKYPSVAAFLSKMGVSNCTVSDSGGDINFGLTDPGFSFAVLSTTSSTAGGISAGPGTAASCTQNSGGWELAWAACPLLTGAGDFTNYLLNGFEGLLSFTIPSNPTGNSGLAQVKQSWTIFRTLASALLVIVLLIVVISQALGGNFLDAYSVRKMLPRIVIAVIAMQLSWELLVWIIGIVDDMGRGIADLMYQPFHGASQMNLGALLDHAGIHAVEQGVINWVLILGGLVLGVAALPSLLVVLLAAGLGLLVGFVTLILRKLIIILAIIFVPVALVLWVLPGNGTQRLWKLWLDNFTKALLMFPLVVMLVAGGRILAYVAGTQGNGTFLNLLIVFVGFFGPLFILPKAFKWGGSAMQFAGNAVSNATKPIAQKGGEGLKGMGERFQGGWAKKYNPEAGLPSRVGRRIQSGHILPTKRSQRLAIAKGDKWSQERDEEALALIKRKGEIVMRDGYETGLKTKDKSSFAKYRKDNAGNLLDGGNNIVYTRGADGNYRDGKGEVTSKFDKADRIAVGSYDESDKETLTGVQAMKQMWVDLADEGRDGHEKKMAIRQLVATRSWPEIQGSLSRRGNKAIDTDAWSSAITTSPEDYPNVLRSRVDATPHIDNAAKKALADAKKGGRVFASRKEEKDFISQFRIKYSIEKQMSNEDFSTQSDGYWEEVARVANLRDAGGNLTTESKAIQTALRERFAAIHAIGGTAPQQLLGHLIGGGVQKDVDAALGPGLNIENFVDTEKPIVGVTSTREAVKSRLETTIPSAVDLTDPNTRAQFKQNLLDPDGPTVEVLSHALAYNVAPATERAEQINALNELKFSAAASLHDTDAYNELIDKIHEAYDQRAAEIVQEAVAKRTNPAEVARIKTSTDAAVAAAKARFTRI